MYDKKDDIRDNGKNKINPSNRDFEGNDKAPGEESGIAEQVSKDDLKGKKIDADPAYEQPIRQLP
jgi:hypothetical protein